MITKLCGCLTHALSACTQAWELWRVVHAVHPLDGGGNNV